jgi:hypothetical protein
MNKSKFIRNQRLAVQCGISPGGMSCLSGVAELSSNSAFDFQPHLHLEPLIIILDLFVVCFVAEVLT